MQREQIAALKAFGYSDRERRLALRASSALLIGGRGRRARHRRRRVARPRHDARSTRSSSSFPVLHLSAPAIVVAAMAGRRRSPRRLGGAVGAVRRAPCACRRPRRCGRRAAARCTARAGSNGGVARRWLSQPTRMMLRNIAAASDARGAARSSASPSAAAMLVVGTVHRSTRSTTCSTCSSASRSAYDVDGHIRRAGVGLGGRSELERLPGVMRRRADPRPCRRAARRARDRGAWRSSGCPRRRGSTASSTRRGRVVTLPRDGLVLSTQARRRARRAAGRPRDGRGARRSARRRARCPSARSSTSSWAPTPTWTSTRCIG